MSEAKCRNPRHRLTRQSIFILFRQPRVRPRFADQPDRYPQLNGETSADTEKDRPQDARGEGAIVAICWK